MYHFPTMVGQENERPPIECGQVSEKMAIDKDREIASAVSSILWHF